MRILVHKIISANVIHHGHWYDDDYDYYIYVRYNIYTNKEEKLSKEILDSIDSLLTEQAELEKNKYNHFYDGSYTESNPVFYHNVDFNGNNYLYEEIDLPVSRKICNILKSNGLKAISFSKVPSEENRHYAHGYLGYPKSYATTYFPLKSDCPYLLFQKQF